MDTDQLLMCGPPVEKKTRVQQCKEFFRENPLLIVPAGVLTMYSLPVVMNFAYLTPWIYVGYKICYKLYKKFSLEKIL